MTSTAPHYAVDSVYGAIQHGVARPATAPLQIDTDSAAQGEFSLSRFDSLVRRTTRWRQVVVHAQFDSTWFNDVVDKPDQALTAPWTQLLKDDTTTTVGLTSFDGQRIVIKRYNPRHPLYAAKRVLRESRASHCLRASIMFTKAGICVPQPVATIEKQFGPLHGTSYFLMLYTPGILLHDWFNGITQLRDEDRPILDAVNTVFNQMREHSLYHGDMKATNLVWQHQRLVVLDLDAARHTLDKSRLDKRLGNDRARFLKNFADRPALQQAIKTYCGW